MVMRAMAGIQDATTFQEARDALLRYYYPLLRTIRRCDQANANSINDSQNWSVSLSHSGSKSSAELFAQSACREPAQLSPALRLSLQGTIDKARLAPDMTPYERVGTVLSWLKEQRQGNPEFAWFHGGLRQWMQGLLTDFTLADAKKRPGAMLASPEASYEKMVESWDASKSGIPFDHVWSFRGISHFTQQDCQPLLAVSDNGGAYGTALAFKLRAKIIQEQEPAMALMLHTNLGATRLLRPTWRDVTDYGVLHPLLTLDESTFDKNVWLDFLAHKGDKWSKPEHESTWRTWQEAAQTSYQRVLQAYCGSTPSALTYKSDGKNPLSFQEQAPLALDWYKLLTQLATRFPYLNQSPQLEDIARKRLNVDELAKFSVESKERIGQPLIQAIIELPPKLQSLDAVNMPAWFHACLQSVMAEQKVLALPEHFLDETQEPGLY